MAVVESLTALVPRKFALGVTEQQWVREEIQRQAGHGWVFVSTYETRPDDDGVTDRVIIFGR